jgi:hypothetical protein
VLLYFLLVSKNLVSNYEQLLILTDIDGSVLVVSSKQCIHDICNSMDTPLYINVVFAP